MFTIHVYTIQVRMGGFSLAAKKIPCLVASEREAVVGMCRREFRALQKVSSAF